MKTMKRAIEDVLLDLGVSPANKGFKLIVDAVPGFNERKSTESIYTSVGEKNGISKSNAEREIRHAFNTISEEKKAEYFGKNVKLCNSTMMSIMCLKIRREFEQV